jgi:peptidyl-prolyl cis-trans isomerase B (cyclophilin B)
VRLGLVIAGIVLLAGCGGNPDPNPNVTSCDVEVLDPGRAREIKPLVLGRTYRIEFQTTHGSFTVEIDEERAPCNGNSMLQLARDGFFDGVAFHRIIPGFVIQGGEKPNTPDRGPGYTTIDAPLPETRYTRGVVAMAKSVSEPPGTGGSQFFVVTGADIELPPEYAMLGKIVQGMDVVDKIGKLGNQQTERPTEKIVIKRAKASGLA